MTRKLLKSNPRIFLAKCIRRIIVFLPDKCFLQLYYWLVMGRPLNLKNPQTFTAKINWLKLYDRKDIYTVMVDKVAVKSYVAKIIGEDKIIPTLGVWDNPDDIDFDALPEKFVLKCNHNSGLGMCICKDKQKLDIQNVLYNLRKGITENIYKWNREWPYKNVPRRILAEEFMEDDNTKELRDYKFFCFGGVVKFFKIDFDRFVEHHANYYNTQGELLPFGEIVCPPLPQRKISLPSQLEKMISMAERLSRNVPFLRVDFYEVNNKVYFGELTFSPDGGFGIWTDDKIDYMLGQWITLPKKEVK